MRRNGNRALSDTFCGIKQVSEWYKIVIYTASLPEYADPVIDFMDSRLCVVAKRFFRDVSHFVA